MKIRIRNTSFEDNCGTDIFARKLANQFCLLGHTLADEEDYDINLVFGGYYNSKNSEKPVVYRVSRIYHDHESIKNIKNEYEESDVIIFQSLYSKNIVESILGKSKKSKIIRNGADIDYQKSTLAGFLKIRNEYKKMFVCATSKWENIHNLEENIEIYKKIRKNIYHDSCLIIVGDSPNVSISDPHIFYTGNLENDELLKLFVIADWTIHMSNNDNCPNIVCESILQGTPVICSYYGGTKEIVNANGITLKNHEELCKFYSKSLPDIKISNLEKLDISHIAKEYIKVFEKVLHKSM